MNFWVNVHDVIQLWFFSVFSHWNDSHGDASESEFCFQHNKPPQSEKTQPTPNSEEAPVPPEETELARSFASFAYQFDCDGLCRKIHLFLFGQFRIVSPNPASPVLLKSRRLSSLDDYFGVPKSTKKYRGPCTRHRTPTLTTLNLF